MAVFLQKTFILHKNSNSNYLKHKNSSIEKLWITQFGPMGPLGTLGPYLGSKSWNVFKAQCSWSSRVWRIPPYQFQLWKISGHLQELPYRWVGNKVLVVLVVVFGTISFLQTTHTTQITLTALTTLNHPDLPDLPDHPCSKSVQNQIITSSKSVFKH